MFNTEAFFIIVLSVTVAAGMLLVSSAAHSFRAKMQATSEVFDPSKASISEALLWIETAGDMYGNGMLTNESRDQIFRECFRIIPYTSTCHLATDPQRIVSLVQQHTA